MWIASKSRDKSLLPIYHDDLSRLAFFQKGCGMFQPIKLE
jgi:hypothetical protein